MQHSDFYRVSTKHEAELSFWWTDDKLHDDEYRFAVDDALCAKIKELESKYAVTDDTRYCCQWEGKLLYSESLEDVTAAIKELAQVLARFKGVVPL